MALIDTVLNFTRQYPQVHIERKGYSGLSELEMREAIRKQYPENMTLKDCLLMSWELGEVGLEKDNVGGSTTTHINYMLAYSLYPALPYGIGANEQAVMKSMYDAMLDKPASYEAMAANVRASTGSDGWPYFNYDYNSLSSLPLDILLQHLLSSFGGSGLYSNDMADELMKMLENRQEI